MALLFLSCGLLQLLARVPPDGLLLIHIEGLLADEEGMPP
jgi:hypothetical protein